MRRTVEGVKPQLLKRSVKLVGAILLLDCVDIESLHAIGGLGHAHPRGESSKVLPRHSRHVLVSNFDYSAWYVLALESSVSLHIEKVPSIFILFYFVEDTI
jgi:hypothetical protein